MAERRYRLQFRLPSQHLLRLPSVAHQRPHAVPALQIARSHPRPSSVIDACAMHHVPQWIKRATKVPLALQEAPHLQQLSGDELAHSTGCTRHQNGVFAFLRGNNSLNLCWTL